MILEYKNKGIKEISYLVRIYKNIYIPFQYNSNLPKIVNILQFVIYNIRLWTLSIIILKEFIPTYLIVNHDICMYIDPAKNNNINFKSS